MTNCWIWILLLCCGGCFGSCNGNSSLNGNGNSNGGCGSGNSSLGNGSCGSGNVSSGSGCGGNGPGNGRRGGDMPPAGGPGPRSMPSAWENNQDFPGIGRSDTCGCENNGRQQ